MCANGGGIIFMFEKEKEEFFKNFENQKKKEKKRVYQLEFDFVNEIVGNINSYLEFEY